MRCRNGVNPTASGSSIVRTCQNLNLILLLILTVFIHHRFISVSMIFWCSSLFTSLLSGGCIRYIFSIFLKRVLRLGILSYLSLYTHLVLCERRIISLQVAVCIFFRQQSHSVVYVQVAWGRQLFISNCGNFNFLNHNFLFNLVPFYCPLIYF